MFDRVLPNTIAQNLPLNDNSIDFLTAFGFMPFLGKGQQELALREMLRVMKPGGVMAIGLPIENPRGKRSTLSIVFNKEEFERVMAARVGENPSAIGALLRKEFGSFVDREPMGEYQRIKYILKATVPLLSDYLNNVPIFSSMGATVIVARKWLTEKLADVVTGRRDVIF